MESKTTVKLILTPEQREQIQQQTGKQITRLKLEALEARIAPGKTPN